MTDTSGKDWFKWHEPYERPGSALADRLELVQTYVTAALDEAPPGPIKVVSLCAGQGRDLIGVVAGHPRRADVRARLVELDPRNTEVAAALAADAGLDFEIVTGDASLSDAYLSAVPAQLVLAVGIFGNITDDDIRACTTVLPMLCAPGAVLVWSRHRRGPDLTPQVRAWFAEAGFEDMGFSASGDHIFVGVGACRWAGDAGELVAGKRLFTFVGDPEIPG